MTTGIYKITNLVNGKVYIGASKNIEKRWRGHRRCISSPIHSDLEALGVENFKFEVLLECPETMLAQWERDMICLYDSDNPEKGYNDKGDRPYNPNISKALKGQKAWNKGISPSDEARRKMSESHKGKPAWNKGLKNIYSDEVRRKISETLKGKSSPMKGKHHSEEVRRKISEANKGHTTSDETRRKISETLKRKMTKTKETNIC